MRHGRRLGGEKVCTALTGLAVTYWVKQIHCASHSCNMDFIFILYFFSNNCLIMKVKNSYLF